MMALYVPEEITLTCQDGIKLAGRRWIRKSGGNEKELRVLCWVSCSQRAYIEADDFDPHFEPLTNVGEIMWFCSTVGLTIAFPSTNWLMDF
jgi:hypothetical protein